MKYSFEKTPHISYCELVMLLMSNLDDGFALKNLDALFIFNSMFAYAVLLLCM